MMEKGTPSEHGIHSSQKSFSGFLKGDGESHPQTRYFGRTLGSASEGRALQADSSV